MKIHLRISNRLLARIHSDLVRPHPFAAERVGFIPCRVSATKRGFLVLPETYLPVEDADYLDDSRVGAMMGPGAIRKALQFAFNNRVSMFHVHLHQHDGVPRFSGIDLRENAKFVPDFWHVRPEFPHGALVLSFNSAAGLCWYPQKPKPFRIQAMTFVGAPMRLFRGGE